MQALQTDFHVSDCWKADPPFPSDRHGDAAWHTEHSWRVAFLLIPHASVL